MTAPDPRPLLRTALDQVGALVADTPADTPADALDRPTPCTDWDVRALLGHLVGVHRRVAHVGAGGHFADVDAVPAVAAGTHAAEIATARADIDRVWFLDDAVLDRVLTVPWGTMPGRFVGFGYVQELTVHAWDLAVATGRTAGLDPALAEAVEETAHRVLPAEPRGGPIPFDPPVPTAPDADPYTRLVGWLGRDPAFATDGSLAER
ncbi:TIGR03086 family metal-binding protein [Actinomycetospora straminea]|uniref:TIGR03086 family metal-binding protein n=1 Tax=Actinomycetospora straminea TaxID=663607 RepID=A0ABP9F6T4_9PSEU|nr:TIGR03086 family metal-binding protein [Actinomycetospora straminea]MDD7936222.1 TIGR03086 family metal-binding protein [Actinomycetospora straminea]